MTMNGDNQSAAPAPLDLRTTHRELPRTPDGLRVRGGSPRGAPGAHHTDTARKRPAERCASKLPFRKRKIQIDTDTQSQSPRDAEDCTPAPDASDLATRDRLPGPTGLSPVPGTLRRDTEHRGPSPGRYHTRYVHSFNYVPYPALCLTPVREPVHPLAHCPENLLTSIALATHQDEDGDTPLHIAVVQGELAIVYRLIHLLLCARRNLDIYNNLRQTPLHLAVITQQAKMVEALLREGADPTALDRNGQTAMHLCCEYHQPDCLAVVLTSPSSTPCLEIRNYEGLSPLHLAVLQGHKVLARMLLDAGADINAMDVKSGQSPLMHAVENNNTDMVHFLIERGCDVNTQSYSGNTALHSACGRGQVDTVRLLLKSGADSSLKNYHNDTPVMVAKNKKIADVLRGRGSNQIKVQDQQSVSASSCGSSITENGSPSPNHSRGCSPSTTPHALHHSSPKTPSSMPFAFY